VGPSDGKTVDLRACATLDLVFTGGTVLSRGGGADLAFHLATLAGLTHVEASRDGQSYVVIGFIGREPDLPPGTSDGCASAMETPTMVTLSLGDCISISEARFLRLSRDTGSAGALVVDAVEALSFKPAGS
jgi:hypothetical protein